LPQGNGEHSHNHHTHTTTHLPSVLATPTVAHIHPNTPTYPPLFTLPLLQPIPQPIVGLVQRSGAAELFYSLCVLDFYSLHSPLRTKELTETSLGQFTTKPSIHQETSIILHLRRLLALTLMSRIFCLIIWGLRDSRTHQLTMHVTYVSGCLGAIWRRVKTANVAAALVGLCVCVCVCVCACVCVCGFLWVSAYTKRILNKLFICLLFSATAPAPPAPIAAPASPTYLPRPWGCSVSCVGNTPTPAKS